MCNLVFEQSRVSLVHIAHDDRDVLKPPVKAPRVQRNEAREEVCYWKDMTLVPHLINLLSKKTICAFVHFTVIMNDEDTSGLFLSPKWFGRAGLGRSSALRVEIPVQLRADSIFPASPFPGRGRTCCNKSYLFPLARRKSL